MRTHLFSIEPKPSIEEVSISPSFRNFPDAIPTPLGVPVHMVSPTLSETISER